MAKPQSIRQGQRVRWSSQSAGFTKVKEGTVVMTERGAKIRYGKYLAQNPAYCALKAFPDHKHMFDSLSWSADGHPGVLVEVITSPNAKPRLYKPKPGVLEVIE